MELVKVNVLYHIKSQRYFCIFVDLYWNLPNQDGSGPRLTVTYGLVSTSFLVCLLFSFSVSFKSKSVKA